MKKETLIGVSLILSLAVVLLVGYYVRTGLRIFIALGLLTGLVMFFVHVCSD